MDCDVFNRSVDITMSRLRQKLNDNPQKPIFIKTVWGTGYVFIGETMGTFVQSVHNSLISSSTGGLVSEATIRVTQEFVTPRYRATSAPE